MASQAIKEYDDFAGQDGYVIVDGLDAQTPGGKKLLSEIGSSGRYTKTTIDASSYYQQSGAVGEYVIPIALNNSFVVVNNIGEGHTVYNLHFTAPTVGSDEVIDVIIEFKLKDNDTGNGHNLNVTNLEFVTEDDYGGHTYINENQTVQVHMIGSCWHSSIAGGGGS